MRNLPVLLLFVLVSLIPISTCDKKQHKNKYSKEANEPSFNFEEKYDPDFRNLQKPFRMAKLNLVWAKAQQRLTEPKLKSLYMELKTHDKEEIAWKQLNSQHKDKDGLKEADLRKKLIGIMSSYDLLEHFDDTQDPKKYKNYRKFNEDSDDYLNKSMFKDKKLNKLWGKAEIAGFTPEELRALKEEFQHHQEKVDMYYSLLEQVGDLAPQENDDQHKNAINEDEIDRFNEIATAEEMGNEINPNEKMNQYRDSVNTLRDHHRTLRDNMERLERKTAKGPHNQDFIEPKVQGLWRVALESNFSEDELSSLKMELHHYETRLLKLRHLHAEHALQREKYKKDEKHADKDDKLTEMEEHIRKQSRKVEKLHEGIEKRIFKHSEL